MRLNLRLIRASQFLQQSKLNVRHKPGKDHFILDTLSCLTSANTGHADPQHFEFDALFIYSIKLIEIYLVLISQILAGYKTGPL